MKIIAFLIILGFASTANVLAQNQYQAVENDRQAIKSDELQISKDSQNYQQYEKQSLSYQNTLNTRLKFLEKASVLNHLLSNEQRLKSQANSYLRQNKSQLQYLQALVQQDKFNLDQDVFQYKHDSNSVRRQETLQANEQAQNNQFVWQSMSDTSDPTDACDSFGNYGFWANPAYRNFILAQPQALPATGPSGQ